jgi:two-component system chemotaxis response regulator CheB
MRTLASLPRKNSPAEHLSVVCFGASAGGLDAYRTILSILPENTGLAFIIVHHQPAEGKSLLTEILPHVTKMPVTLIADGELVKANRVYIVPAGQQVTMDGDLFRIAPLLKPSGWPKNISIFLQSLADDRKKRAIAVILSGFDSDGAAALQSIKDEGGIVFAQAFKTAKQPDMPKSAVKTGCVDYLLSPSDIADKLVRIAAERRQGPVDATVVQEASATRP